MLVLGNLIALLLLSFVSTKPATETRALEALLQKPILQQMVAAGDLLGLERELERMLGEGMSFLPATFAPYFSAYVLGRALLSLPLEAQTVEAGQLVEKGILRKLNVNHRIAPRLLSFVLEAAKRQEFDSRALRQELGQIDKHLNQVLGQIESPDADALSALPRR